MRGIRIIAALLLAFAGLCLSPAAAADQPGANASNFVTLNFPGVPVQEAAKAVLGDILGLNYAVDSGAQGTITLETTRQVTRTEVLPLFEEALEKANLALVHRAGTYVVVPLAEAKRQAQLIGAAKPGFGSEAIQLKYVSATSIKKLIDPLIPENSITSVDEVRNILVVTGTGTERKAVRDLVDQFDVNWLQGMSFELFVPRHTDSKVLVPQIDQLLNAPGAPTAGLVRLIALDRSNAIVAISTQPKYLADVRRLIDKLDAASASTEPHFFVYRVQNGRAADLADVLVKSFGQSSAAGSRPGSLSGTQRNAGAANTIANSTLPGAAAGTGGTAATMPGALGGAAAAQTIQIGNSPSPVTVTSDETNNAVVVYATEHQYSIIEEALRKLDILPLQVMIEAVVTEVTLNNDLQYGTQWFFSNGDSKFTLSSGSSSTLKEAFPGFSYLISSGSSIKATLDALAKVTTIKVDSAPKVLVLNNHTADLQVGDQVPVATESATSTETSSAPIVNSIQYVDTGVILKVTPRVNDSGLVLLDISQEVSDVSTTSSSQIDSPTIQQRRISSSIAIQDGQTVALGGLITDTRQRTSSGIPYLSEIPVLGSLFGTQGNKRDRTELLVLLTPHVVRNNEDALSVTEELRSKMTHIAPLPPPKKRPSK